jgi:hypothetical protein
VAWGIAVGGLVVAILASVSHGGTTTWWADPGSPGNWSEPLNWTAGVPGATSWAYINNGGEALINAGAAAERLYLGSSAGTSGSITHSAGAYVGKSTTGWTPSIELGGAAGASGNYTISGSASIDLGEEGAAGGPQGHSGYLLVGTYGTGRFVQNGATVTLTGGVALGDWGSASEGAYILTDGLLRITGYWMLLELPSPNPEDPPQYEWVKNPGSLSVGFSGPATFQQDGGTVQVDSGMIYIYRKGTYTLGGAGSISSSGGVSVGGRFTQDGGLVQAYLGVSGTYELRQGRVEGSGASIGGLDARMTHTTGVVALAGTLRVGFYSGPGTYELLGAGELTAQYAEVGSGTAGVLDQRAGKVTIGGLLVVGQYYPGGNGTYLLGAPGELSAAHEYVGWGGAGSIAQTGGKNTVSGTVILGGAFNGIAGSTGHYQLSGGEFEAKTVRLGYGGSGRVLHTGGTATVTGSLFLGTCWNGEAGDGTYQLSGDGVLSAADEYVGDLGWAWAGDVGEGLFQQDAGKNSAERLYLGFASGSRGTYLINAGELHAGQLHVGKDGAGTLEIAGAAALVEVGELLRFSSTGTFTVAPGSTIHMTGAAFENQSTDPAALAGLKNLRMVFEGGPGQVDSFEVAGEDMGPAMAGLESNFALDTLELGGQDTGQVRLVDLFDNRPAWTGAEALYVENLILGSGALLDLNGLGLYYLHASIDPGATVLLNGGDLAQIPEPGTLLLLGLGGLAALRRRQR